MDDRSLHRWDLIGLVAFCAVLFGICLVSERPLSIHEAVLPQTSRLMLADGDLIVPKTGEAPWLESPPLPQWISTALAVPFGELETHFVARLGNVLVAILIVLMAAWTTAKLFGRNMGLLTGLCLATMCEFTKYAWLAEDEIYLCAVITAVIAWFVHMEFNGEDAKPITKSPWYLAPFTTRSSAMLTFFLLLGLTNLCKGIIFGMVLALIPCVSFIVLQLNYARLKPYLSVWGVLLTLAVAAVWPVACYFRYPDVVDVWMFDLGGRVDGKYAAINQPLWYYPVNMLWMLAPWTFFVPVGMVMTWKKAWKDPTSAERFVWCWALLVPAVLSIPAGKHHHYLLHGLVPWAMLGSIGLVRAWAWMHAWPTWLKHPAWSLLSIATPACVALVLLRSKLPGPESTTWGLIATIPVAALMLAWGITRTDRRYAVSAMFGVTAAAYLFGHVYSGHYIDKNRLDAHFCQQVAKDFGAVHEAQSTPLLMDLGFQTHRAFLCQFYLPETVKPLHNLSFLRSSDIHADEAYVLSISGKQQQLEQYGAVEVVRQNSTGAGGSDSTDDRLTVYRIRFPEKFERVATEDVRISPMQGMNRATGPEVTVIR